MQEARQRKIYLGDILSEYGAVIAFFVLFIVNAVITTNFLNIRTVWNILTQSTSTILLGLGMTVVIATGGINISVGSCMALTAMISAMILRQGNIPLAIIAGLAVAIVFGIITGYIVIKLKVQPMIVSLSLMFIMRGLAKIISGGKVNNYGNKAFSDFFYEYVFWDKVPVRVVIWLVMAILLWILLSRTRYGNYIEAYGDNPNATYISGVHVTSVITA